MAGNKQILYGIGKAALRDYANPKKLISLPKGTYKIIIPNFCEFFNI